MRVLIRGGAWLLPGLERDFHQLGHETLACDGGEQELPRAQALVDGVATSPARILQAIDSCRQAGVQRLTLLLDAGAQRARELEQAAAPWRWRGTGVALTVVRLPVLYGPGDTHFQLAAYWRRMHDRRPAILLPPELAHRRTPRGYIENVTAATVAATIAPRAAGRIYWATDGAALTEAEWVKHIARACGWSGRIVITDRAPASDNRPRNWLPEAATVAQDLQWQPPHPLPQALAGTLAWEKQHAPPPDPALTRLYTVEDALLRSLGLVAIARAG